MIPLFKVRMAPSVNEPLKKVLHSGYIGQGPKVEEFEDALKENLRVDVRPVTVNSGTSALDLALELIGVGFGDTVISTPQTCFASNSVILNRGAQIVWADIDPITGLMDPEDVAKIIKEKPYIKAIMAVNWAGALCDYKALKSHGISVIEDAAHSWNTEFLGRERGDYICHSFQAIKFLTTGDGGCLIPPEDKAEQARTLRWYGLDRTKGESFRCTQNIRQVGFKYHMNDIAATIGLENLPGAKDSVREHVRNAMVLDKGLEQVDWITTPVYKPSNSYWLYTILVHGRDRDEFAKYLTKHDIGNSPVHFRNDTYDVTQNYATRELPGVDQFTKTQLNIPVGWWLNKIDLAKIISTIQNYE